MRIGVLWNNVCTPIWMGFLLLDTGQTPLLEGSRACGTLTRGTGHARNVRENAGWQFGFVRAQMGA